MLGLLLTGGVFLICMALIVIVYVAVFSSGIIAPSLVFALLVGLGVWQSASWIWGILSGLAVFGIVSTCMQYRKAHIAITIFTAIFVNYFMVLMLGPFFPAIKAESNVPSTLGLLISLVMAVISIFFGLSRTKENDLDDDPLWCVLVASIVYGFTAVCVLNFALQFPQEAIAAVINWALLIGVSIVSFVLMGGRKPLSALFAGLTGKNK